MISLHRTSVYPIDHFWTTVLLVYTASVCATTVKSWGGPRFGSQHRGACAPARPVWLFGAGGDCPLPLWGSGDITPQKNYFGHLRRYILHSGDYLLWNFLLFENYGQKVGAQQYLKVGEQSPPVPTVFAPMHIRIYTALCSSRRSFVTNEARVLTLWNIIL